jgi:hypothetical protein
MFSRFAKNRATIGALLVASALLSASLVAPAFGAPGPLTLAKRALKTAKKANKTAKAADKRSKSASSIANSALSKANAPNQDAGPTAIRESGGILVPDDGSSVEDFVECPSGMLAAGGGVAVFDDDTGDPVPDGLSVTESTTTGGGWYGAVQDASGANGHGDRFMYVSVQCAKPGSVDFGPGVKARQSKLRQR